MNQNRAYKFKKTICIVTYYPFIKFYEESLKIILGLFFIKNKFLKANKNKFLKFKKTIKYNKDKFTWTKSFQILIFN